MKNLIEWYKRSLFFRLMVPVVIGAVVIFLCIVISWLSRNEEIVNERGVGEVLRQVMYIGISSGVLALLIILPISLTVLHVNMLYRALKNQTLHKGFCIVDGVTFFLGLFLSVIYLEFVMEVQSFSHWSEQLINQELHAPILVEAIPYVFLLFICGLVGYMVLTILPIEKTPPLVAVFSIGSLYCSVITIWVCFFQLLPQMETSHTRFWSDHVFLMLFPICITCIALRTVTITIKNTKEHALAISRFKWVNRFLQQSYHLTWLGFIACLPIITVITCVAMLFGQEPDILIKAWTETSDWALSQQVAPQNLVVDTHYLCTVAAGGHRKVVKPMRMGVRHGHAIIVNRQLCIANAFEDIIQEKFPRFHKIIRYIYDRYGFPIARLIRSQTAADITYIIMKPLEWLFLMVIYLVDAQPENRIAVQYTGKRVEDILQDKNQNR